MRPTEERSPYGYGDGDDRPDPLVAQSAPEFVAQLRALVQWSGLTLEEVEQLARANGDILPPSIVSVALSHNTLPPEEVVVALVAAIGDDDEMVELWASVLWRLEDMEAAATMAPMAAVPHQGQMAAAPHQGPMVPRQGPMPPHGAPPSAPASSAAGSRQYSGSLADAVQKRQNQDSWRGLHRGFQRGLRATGLGAKFGSWPAPVAIAAAIVVVIAGVTWAVAGGGEDTPQPRANPCCVGQSGDGTPSAGPSEEILPSEMTVVLPLPSGSTKASPTPRLTTPPPRNSPTPTQTQTQQNAVLTGNGSVSSCQDNGTDWTVTLTVTAELSGATIGNDPQGQGGKSGDLRPITFSGGGGDSFSGSVSATLGASPAATSGSLQWNITVTVPGVGPVSDDGTVTYNCGG